MPTRPNPIPAMLHQLSHDQQVTDLCGANIFGATIPAQAVDAMPQNLVVLTRAGGHAEGYLPMHTYRIQATCYGGGKEPDTSDEYQASLVSSAVADALDFEGSMYWELTVIKSILLIGGPVQIKDDQLNDTPGEVLFFNVFMPTVALVAPY
jgi:hypothetical protein